MKMTSVKCIDSMLDTLIAGEEYTQVFVIGGWNGMFSLMQGGLAKTSVNKKQVKRGLFSAERITSSNGFEKVDFQKKNKYCFCVWGVFFCLFVCLFVCCFCFCFSCVLFVCLLGCLFICLFVCFVLNVPILKGRI